MRALTLTLHPAIDRVLEIEQLTPGTTCDAKALLVVPAGKGVNTARVLARMWGTPRQVVAAVWLGEGERRWFTERLRALSGIGVACCARACQTRQAMTVLEASGRETHIKEVMPPPSAAEERALLEFWVKTVRRGDLVALCGSAPRDTTMATLKKIFTTARRCGVSAIVADASGAALQAAGEAGLDGLKGNEEEIGAWLGLREPFDVSRAGHRRALRASFENPDAPRCILVTRGAKGALAATAHALISATLPDKLRRRHGSVKLQAATGCGDAATAGWLWALSEGCALAESLRRAVACGTAKIASADPGHIDPVRVNALVQQIRVAALEWL